MSDLIAAGVSPDIVKGTSEAITETAKAAQAGFALLDSLGKSSVGKAAADLAGVLGGAWLHHKHIRIEASLQAKTAALLAGIETGRISEPSPSVVAPLIEAARDEVRESLQDLWAALLANSMIDGGTNIRGEFIEVLKIMEPVDAAVLKLVADRPAWAAPPVTHDGGWLNGIPTLLHAARSRGISQDDLAMALDALERLGCIARYVQDGPPRTRPLGAGLLAACTVR
jgi:hypothetical protein